MAGPRTDASDAHSEAPFSDALLDVLLESQRLGFFGERSVSHAAQHSRGFVRGLAGVSGTVIDIGAGGGLPGLVIAHDRPDLDLVLVDRRAKRTDFLRRMVKRLGWDGRIRVREADVREVVLRREDDFDAVVARGFGPPAETIDFASQLIAGHGRIVISEPPAGDRWDPDHLQTLGLRRIDDRSDHVSVFERRGSDDVSRET